MPGHVNNVTYVRYAESARINWAQNFANHIDPKHKKEWSELWTPKGDGLILRSMKTDYKFVHEYSKRTTLPTPMAWPDRISVYHKLRAAPTATTDSFILDVLILSERYQRPAARCVEDIVVYDYRRGVKSPLRNFMVEKLGETFELQEQSRIRNERRVRDLLQRVQRLEKQVWDRPDAVEDMGSA
ncbi:hypothetical protein HO173_001171 [Letharia columbiana]|uniref:Thioesterase/thiol ester dehydrase-isomerase n=1 Tax=Letharia columbiana TaxID=112416 RepID=A0A8H6L9H2_9LECA|nr:uncharacterized protein HO173_001171 [Letharia columbiana]KAF6240503.1 hypothetical protein HO173_001171 [Letharia columbiana]